MDPTRLELSPERLRQIQNLVEEIRRLRRTRQYPGGRPNSSWQPARYRRRRRG